LVGRSSRGGGKRERARERAREREREAPTRSGISLLGFELVWAKTNVGLRLVSRVRTISVKYSNEFVSSRALSLCVFGGVGWWRASSAARHL